MKTKQIGHVTLHEGTNGKWVGGSFALSNAFERLGRGEITAEEYVEDIKRRLRDERTAHSLFGQKA